MFVALNPLNTGVFSKYGVQKKNPTLPDTIVSELEWDYGAGNIGFLCRKTPASLAAACAVYGADELSR